MINENNNEKIDMKEIGKIHQKRSIYYLIQFDKYCI